MKQYLRWAQVQQRLLEHYQATGTPYSFYDAARELWEEGKFQNTEELPAIRYRDWDSSDMDELEKLLDQTPVDLDIFYRDFQSGTSAQAAAAQHIAMDIVPIRIARYQALGAHTHDSFKVIYVARGTARLICSGTSLPLPAGSLCLISPHFTHDAVSDDDGILLSVALSEQTIEETLFLLLRHESVIADFFRFGLKDSSTGYMLFTDLEPQEVLPLFRNLFHEFYVSQEYYRDACASYIELIFVYLLRRGGEWYGQTELAQEGRRTMPILAILKHIQTNYKTTSLNETAAMFHYEPDYLGRQIKAKTGKNYSQLVCDLRIADAKRLLRTTGLSMKEIAEASGFRSSVHFFRSFRKVVGMTPSDWRKTSAEFKDGKC